MTDKLLPCPFCGGQMTLKISRSNGHQVFGKHTKDCAFSDVSACMQEPSDCEWVADEIIKRWNTRAAPHPPAGAGLEVVAHLEGDEAVVRPHRVYADARRKYDYARRANGAEPLVRLSDHLRAIAELREELDAAREILAQQGRRNTELRAERDTLRQHQRIADDFIVELDLANARNMTLRTDLAAARLQTAMMVVCAKNLADERDALLATIELMQSKQQLVGYTMRSSLKPLMDDTMPDGKHIRIGVDHRACWEDDTPYDNLIPLYVIGDV